MQLELGKTYQTRDGRAITITDMDGNKIFPFGGEGPQSFGRQTFRPDGSWNGFDKNPIDIVAEAQ